MPVAPAEYLSRDQNSPHFQTVTLEITAAGEELGEITGEQSQPIGPRMSLTGRLSSSPMKETTCTP
jgi:hypothetical protein